MVSRERVIQLDTPTFPRPTESEPDERAPETQQFDRLAKIVRSIYILLRTAQSGSAYEPGAKWDGGTDRFGRNYTPVWPRLARFFVEHQLEPLAYIRAQFWQAKKGRIPLPNALMSADAVATYELYRRQIAGDVAQQLQWELGSVRSEMLPVMQGLGWSQERTLRWALTNERTVKASVLTRYCLAVEYGLVDIAESYHDGALFQYAFQKNAYDASWPEGVIPEALKADALALISRITCHPG